MRTAQEIYDKIATHLLAQNAKSTGKREPSLALMPGCRYRGANGLQCAIGCDIPDDEYSPELEGRSIRRLIEMGAFSAKRRTEYNEHLELLIDLQSMHDNVPVSLWLDRLDEIASAHGLKPIESIPPVAPAPAQE